MLLQVCDLVKNFPKTLEKTGKLWYTIQVNLLLSFQEKHQN